MARHEGLARLATSDIPHVRDDVNGVHSWDVWRQELAIFAARWAFRHTTTSGEPSGTRLTATVRASTNEPAEPTGTVQFSAGGQPLGAPVAARERHGHDDGAAIAGAARSPPPTRGDALYNTSIGLGGVRRDQHDRHGRRHRAGDAVADARRAGSVRRVHARRRQGVHGDQARDA